jgi:two-component system CheB/CheR fusion protein
MTKKAIDKKKIVVRKKGEIEKTFPIVAIGASAGGLEAVSLLLKYLPANTGMAYIYVQHLSPDHKSFLPDILSKITKMKVQEITDMEHMVANTVYVIPYNYGIKVTDGHIKLTPRLTGGAAMSIDVLFSSLAETHQENVIGVILSGNAHDGTIGIKAIKEAGGLTFAQDVSAQSNSMPESAVATGMVDFVLSPKGIALKLASLYKNGLLKHQKIKTNAVSGNSDIKLIFDILHKQKGVDFSYYKMATIKRRLNNRMLQSEVHTIKDYTKILQVKNSEVDLLYKDLLINVSSFFRDIETFDYLKATFLPRLLKNRSQDETLRIWVPACSRGEEAYSIAMLITELQADSKIKIPVQIFATDLSEQVIRDARIAKYAQSDMASVSPKRIKRFFIKVGEEYTIVKEIREMCVFAPHNILRDPPFFRIDFISCRNLLIYFDAVAQKKSLSIIHFALKEGGYLMLGKAETIGTTSQLFTQKNNTFKIYTRKNNLGIRKVPQLAARFPGMVPQEKNIKPNFSKNIIKSSKELDGAIDSVLLSRYMPACAVINKEMEILQFRGPVSVYLTHPSGKASLNILKMIRPECAFELRDAIQQVIKTNLSVYKKSIEVENDSVVQCVSIEVSPMRIQTDESLLLIVFTPDEQIDKYAKGKTVIKSRSTLKDIKIKKLTDELSHARAEILSIIESQEKAYEELQVANEEIVSANEEFQTLNEELETSKEEIEATNEELITTNQELKMHNELLAESYDYSQAIIETIHEPMIVLDSNLHVKSANKSFYNKFLVTTQETEGMPLFELGNNQWDISELRILLLDMLSKNSHFENFKVTHVFPKMGEKVMLLNATRIIQKTHREKLILLAIEDITELTRHYVNEKRRLKGDIVIHKADNAELEKAVQSRTKQLYDKNIELANANKDLTSFTYLSSHDLQEPLRKIQMFVSCLMEEEEVNLSILGKSYLQRTNATARRMQELIKDLLIYSGTKTIDRLFEKTNLNDLFQEVENNFKEEIDEKKAIFHIEGHCEVEVIRFQFRQLLQNLISNSLKFSSPNIAPIITIKSAMVHVNMIKNELVKGHTSYCHIVYTDNGIGFNPEYNERIFEVFQRLHTKTEYIGTGMGLAICKRIVENHHGIIKASGKLKKGVQFDIYIPIKHHN